MVLDQQLQVEVSDGRGIQDSPELTLPRPQLDQGGWVVWKGYRYEVDAQVFRGFTPTGAGIEDVALGVAHDHGRGHGVSLNRGGVRIHQLPVTDDQYPFGKSGQRRVGALNAFDNQCTGSATEHLCLGDAMDMRVIPVESRRLVGWNPQAILERLLACLDQGIEHVVLVTDRGHRQAVKMQVGCGGAHRPARAAVRGGVLVSCRDVWARSLGPDVFQA